jgi:hypothetical protein
MNGRGDQGVRAILDSFGRARLLSFDHDPASRGPTVEVAHEALLREWPRLRDWLDQSRADIRIERVLGNSAQDWLAAEEDPSFLLRGARLDQFAAWSQTTDVALTQVEADYLEASLAERRARQTAEEQRLAHEAALERRSRNFLRGLVAVMGIAMVVALVLSLYAFNQQRAAQHSAATATIAQGQAQVEAATAVAAQQEAQTQTERADQAAANAQAQKAIAEGEARAALEAYSLSLAPNAQQALDARDPVTALALAMAANRIADPPLEAQRILLEAAYAPGPRHRFNSYEISEIRSSEVFSLDISPDEQTALIGGRDKLIWLDLDTLSTVKQIWSFELAIAEVHFLQDGNTALIGIVYGIQILWDLIAGEELHRFEGHTSGFDLHSMDISVDERYAVSGGGNEIVLWEIETGREIRRFDLDPLITSESQLFAITGLVFSPDGYTVIGSFNSSQDTNFF